MTNSKTTDKDLLRKNKHLRSLIGLSNTIKKENEQLELKLAATITELEKCKEALRDLVEVCHCQNGCAPDDMTCATMKARAVLEKKS